MTHQNAGNLKDLMHLMIMIVVQKEVGFLIVQMIMNYIGLEKIAGMRKHFKRNFIHVLVKIYHKPLFN